MKITGIQQWMKASYFTEGESFLAVWPLRQHKGFGHSEAIVETREFYCCFVSHRRIGGYRRIYPQACIRKADLEKSDFFKL